MSLVGEVMIKVLHLDGDIRKMIKFSDLEGEVMNFKFSDLEEITDKFSEEFKVSSSGYVHVFRGMYNGQEVAVKFNSQKGLEDQAFFHNKVRSISKINHQNVVRFIGYCYEKHDLLMSEGIPYCCTVTEQALCFEHMHGGSLDEHINDESCDFDWPTCYKIIRRTSEGLNHLHNSQESPIFHLDLKPSNILLDKNLTAKIKDFCFSISSEYAETYESRRGTGAYMPPEYVNSGLISNKFDVFSLGVIVLKIMAGNIGYSHCYELAPKQFVELVIDNWKERLQSTSGHSTVEIDILRVEACVNIALRCLVHDQYRRPSVKDIVNELEVYETVELFQLKFLISQELFQS